jgi:hypothetical protein
MGGALLFRPYSRSEKPMAVIQFGMVAFRPRPLVRSASPSAIGGYEDGAARLSVASTHVSLDERSEPPFLYALVSNVGVFA